MLTWPVATVGWVTSIVQQAEASQKRINEFLSEKNNIINFNKNDYDINGFLEFKNVSHNYSETGIDALTNVNFKVEKGQSLGIIGPVGSGKSTILEMIVRNYDPDSGKILIDKKNLQNHNLNNLRKYIGYVPQSTFLFSDTIYNNIIFGNSYSDSEEIYRCSKIACIHKDILSFPKKYSSMLGERGINLSGGQKQRLAIARALLKKPKILLLDDSLSALDTVTEKKIIKNLDSQVKNITKIIVSHRISTIEKCDIILVLIDGSVSEIGNHQKLYKLNGYYRETFDKQKSKN